MSTKLIEYLSTLNSSETQWGLWVNPNNYDEFRIVQGIFHLGEIDDGWVCVGSLDSLSFGHQSDADAFEQAAAECMTSECDFDGLYEAWCEDRLEESLQNEITEAVEAIHGEWSDAEASVFVYDKLPEIIEEAIQYQESAA